LRQKWSQGRRVRNPKARSSGASRRSTNFLDLDRLCLWPQHGFASTEEDNILAAQEQWAKLRLIVEIAEET
jgi:hypothetical protein